MHTISASELESATGGRYDVSGVVATGGMAVVYRGVQRALGAPVAIKVLPREVALSTVRLARFRREATLASRLSHPNIVPVFECDVQGEIAYLVMPFIDGETLAARLKSRGPMPWPEAIAVLRQVGAALAFAHERRVVHRDVKPSNILFETATQRWLLTDFGVAHAAQPDDETITHTGAALGTPAYMAPEQAGGSVDERADLFALAAVAYELLTGQAPDRGESVDALGKTLRQARPDIPGDTARDLVSGLAAARDERPASVNEWLRRMTGRKPSRRLGVAVGAIAVVLVGAWIAARRGRAAPPEAPAAIAVLPFSVAGVGPPNVGLDSIVPQAFAWQLAMLPDTRVVSPPVLDAGLRRRFGKGPTAPESLAAVAASLGASAVVSGQVGVVANRMTIRVAVRNPVTHAITATADTAGPVDSLHALISGLVVQAFAKPAARAREGWAASLPRGLPAIVAYFQGDRNFRHGDYPAAINDFERVIALDSTYAPAHFKRMLAAMQLSPTSGQIHSALDAVQTYARGLDPVSRELLGGYADLLKDGDLKKAERTFRNIVERYPDAVDAWFALGELLFHFAPLLGTPLGEAQRAFDEALAADPTFAAPVAHLLTLAIARGDDAAAKSYMARYLLIDSVSVLAELVRAGDTLLYQRAAAPVILASFPKRDTPFLKQIAFLSSQFGRGALERSFGERAIDELWRRAVTRDEKTQAFRLKMATLLAGGREASALAFMPVARAKGVPGVELDRWVVLSATTALPRLGDLTAQQNAAGRLATNADDSVVNAWLAARWYERQGDRERAQDLAQRVADVADQDSASPLEKSLRDDLTGAALLAAGDTNGAIDAWQKATGRFNIEQVPFALVGSLWPVRLRLARVALPARPDVALAAAGTFHNLAGFVDQAAWPEALTTGARAALATGDTTLAINTYRHLLELLSAPNGGGVLKRQQAAGELAGLSGQNGQRGPRGQ